MTHFRPTTAHVDLTAIQKILKGYEITYIQTLKLLQL